MKTKPHAIRWLVLLVLGGLAVYYIVPRLGELDDIAATLQHAHPGWLLAAILAALATYACAAFVLTGSTRRRLAWGEAWLVQVAATVLNRTTPKGVGSIAMLEQYLEHKRLRRAEAAAAVTLIYAAGVAVHLALLAATLAALQPSGFKLLPASPGQLALAAGLAVLSLGGLLLIPRFKRSLVRWGSEVRRGLRYDRCHPAKLVQLFGGSAGITLCHVLGLYFSLLAVGSDAAFVAVMFIYLAGSAVASASPTPGGLGAIEAALVLGLTATPGVAGASQAVAGVLVFRLISFWLPLLPGVIALRLVIRRRLI